MSAKPSGFMPEVHSQIMHRSNDAWGLSDFGTTRPNQGANDAGDAERNGSCHHHTVCKFSMSAKLSGLMPELPAKSCTGLMMLGDIQTLAQLGQIRVQMMLVMQREMASPRSWHTHHTVCEFSASAKTSGLMKEVHSQVMHRSNDVWEHSDFGTTRPNQGANDAGCRVTAFALHVRLAMPFSLCITSIICTLI